MNTNQEQLAFFHQLGVAITHWQDVELALYLVLQAAAHDRLPRDIFQTFVTHKPFRIKLAQIDEAMRGNFKDTPFFEEWQSLKSTADNAALERHKLAHNWVLIDPHGRPGRRWRLRPPLGKKRQPPELREVLPNVGILCVKDIWKIGRRFTALDIRLNNFALRLSGKPEWIPTVPDTTGPAPSLAEFTREIQRLANTDP